MKPERFGMLFRDLGCTIVGLGGIVYQVLTVEPGDLNEAALLILALVAGVPGAAQLWSLRNGGTTDSSSLPSPPEVPQPESPSSSQSV